MKYSTGKMERVFAITIEHGESAIEQLAELARKENIRNGYIFVLGALGSGRVVTGPKDLSLPTAPMWGDFSDGREVVAFGSVCWKDNAPKTHLHVVAGRGGDTLVGCLREGGKAHILLEAVLFETRFDALSREYDEGVGAWMPKHG
jgi:predicted DNA-binding protein with PD1-like motif